MSGRLRGHRFSLLALWWLCFGRILVLGKIRRSGRVQIGGGFLGVCAQHNSSWRARGTVNLRLFRHWAGSLVNYRLGFGSRGGVSRFGYWFGGLLGGGRRGWFCRWFRRFWHRFLGRFQRSVCEFDNVPLMDQPMQVGNDRVLLGRWPSTLWRRCGLAFNGGSRFR